MTPRRELFRIKILNFLRVHRCVNNLQVNKAFWHGKSFKISDSALKTLVKSGLVKHLKVPELKPSNYYMLAREGFNFLVERKITFENETFFAPENEEINISATFEKRVMLADIHISLMHKFKERLATWMPDFEFEVKRKNFGVNTKNQKVLAAVIPDGILLFKNEGQDQVTVLRFHYFDLELEKFMQRFREFEFVWANYHKIIITRDAESVAKLEKWYIEGLSKYYPAGKDSKFPEKASKYSFADFQTLQSSGKLHTSTLKP